MVLSLEFNANGVVLDAREAVAVLQRISPKLATEARNEMKSAVNPALASVRALIPEKPARGWMHRGRTGWLRQNPRTAVTVEFVKQRRSTKMDTFPLLTVVQPTAAGTIFDLAKTAAPGGRQRLGTGRDRIRTDSQNQAFIANLNKWALPSRSMWPGVQRAIPDIEAAMKVAVENVERILNAELR